MTLDQELDKLGRMTPAELRARWRDLFRKPAPSVTSEMMARAIAYRIQERRHGGLAASTRREIARLARKAERTGHFDEAPEIALKAGTRLVREWRGRTIKITVLDDGFEWECRRYGSLSQIAREVTGSAWSGPLFFGLRSRKAPPTRDRGGD